MAQAVLFAVMLVKCWWMTAGSSAFQPAARLMLALWAIIAFIGLAADEPFSATALMLALFALRGPVECAWSREAAAGGR